MIKVILISHTSQPEMVITNAGKLCYSALNIDDLNKKITPAEAKKFVEKLKKLGHTSVFEHISFTFAAEGISRACTHQLVRHRIASYSQQSQRYVKKKNFQFIFPPTLNKNKKAKEIFLQTINTLQQNYEKLLNLNIPAEDARYILPNACETKITITMNARELLHFFKLRLCDRAQWEIRNLADEMLKLVKEVAPTVFKNAGPACVTGPCTEGEFYCGKLKEYREKYKDK